ncbi:hypothetical protein QE521_01315 [Streptococcus suis]|uniref:hypothetical protein n=1 Tax=Streptococcus suis TaxID=1307 RepID=UPI00375735E3
MFEHTREFINRVTLDPIPNKVSAYKESHSIFCYQLLYNKDLEGSDNEPYYGKSKDVAKSQIYYILRGKRDKMSAKSLELIAENMGIPVSTLLWNEEKDWQCLLPALFYLIIFESLKANKARYGAKISLRKKAESVLKESVIFSSELAKKEIEADLSDGLIVFTIQNKNLAQTIFRLYQPTVEEKFYLLFKEVFIDSNYAMDYLERKLIQFADRVFEEVLFCSSVDQNSIGYQIYKTYDLYFSSDAREYRSSINIIVDERFSGLNMTHVLSEEQQKISNALSMFVSELVKLQELQDKRLGYRKTDKKIFKIGFDLAGFDKEYFHTTEVQIEQEQLTIDKLEDDIKKAYEDNTLPI